MADILTLAELKTARGETGNDHDTQYTWFLAVVSALFRAATERDIGTPVLTEERTFQYDGSGYLDIDDAAAVLSVKLVVPYGEDLELDADFQWTAQPPRRDDSPVHTYLQLYGVGTTGVPLSPEMGFNRNLDVYYREHRLPAYPTVLKVTAQWGWPTVPVDIKQAAVWTINEWIEKDDEGEGLTAEAIAGYSRSWQRDGGDPTASSGLALPARARDVLAHYAKIQV